MLLFAVCTFVGNEITYTARGVASNRQGEAIASRPPIAGLRGMGREGKWRRIGEGGVASFLF